MSNVRKFVAGAAMAAILGSGIGASFILPANAASAPVVSQTVSKTVAVKNSALTLSPSLKAFFIDDHLQMTNQIRKAKGLKPLTLDKNLSQGSDNWASTVTKTGKVTGNPKLATSIPKGASASGDNVGINGGKTLITSWANADKSKKKILGNYTHMGVGVKVDQKGDIYFVQTYANYPKTHIESKVPPAKVKELKAQTYSSSLRGRAVSTIWTKPSIKSGYVVGYVANIYQGEKLVQTVKVPNNVLGVPFYGLKANTTYQVSVSPIVTSNNKVYTAIASPTKITVKTTR